MEYHFIFTVVFCVLVVKHFRFWGRIKFAKRCFVIFLKTIFHSTPIKDISLPNLGAQIWKAVWRDHVVQVRTSQEEKLIFFMQTSIIQPFEICVPSPHGNLTLTLHLLKTIWWLGNWKIVHQLVTHDCSISGVSSILGGLLFIGKNISKQIAMVLTQKRQSRNECDKFLSWLSSVI